jgi:hypothetical protein
VLYPGNLVTGVECSKGENDMPLFGQYLTPDTPIYLVVYHTAIQSFSGYPVFEIIKVYSCEFQDYDALTAQHASTPGNYQAICFLREVANPFQSQAVDTSDPFNTDTTLHSQLWTPPQTKPRVTYSDDSDPFLDCGDDENDDADTEDSVWDM